MVKTHQYGSKTTSTVDTLRAQLTTRLSHCLLALASRDPPILLFIRKRKLDEQCNSPDSPHHWRIGKQTLALPGVNPWWTLPRRGFDAKSTHLHHVWWNDARRAKHQRRCSENATHSHQARFPLASPLPKRWTMQNVPSSTDVKTCARGRCALTVNSVNNSIHLAQKTLLLVLGRSTHRI